MADETPLPQQPKSKRWGIRTLAFLALAAASVIGSQVLAAYKNDDFVLLTFAGLVVGLVGAGVCSYRGVKGLGRLAQTMIRGSLDEAGQLPAPKVGAHPAEGVGHVGDEQRLGQSGGSRCRPLSGVAMMLLADPRAQWSTHRRCSRAAPRRVLRSRRRVPAPAR